MTEGSKTDKELQLRDSMEMEGASAKKLPYPKGCFFIMATELSERFSYYGMRAVLTIYMRNELDFSENKATSFYHIFLMLCYGLPVVWGVMSDSLLGKYKTIFFVSILFAVGNVTLTLSSIPPLKLPVEAFFFIGLFLMAVGTAGMKPCVAPLGGEQFVLPQQENQLKQFFSLFFFAITIGNMISTVITPVFRRDVSCFGMENCYPLAFGVPATIMLLAIVVFVSGKSLYVINQPNGNMIVKVVKCMSYAISNRGKKSGSESPSSKAHWLDSAADKYDESLIADTKGLLRVLVYYLPVPMFFALYEQLGSRWTLQATRMNGRIGNFIIKPEQMQVSNAILMFIFLPFFQYAIYPIFGKFGLFKKPLQKMVVGGVLASLSFAVAGIVETKIEPAVRSEPASGLTVLNFANNVPCPIDIWLNSSTSARESDYTVNINDVFTLPPLNFKNRQILARTVSENCSGSNLGLDVQWFGVLDVAPKAYQTASISVTSNNSLSVSPLPFEDDFAKSKDGNARVRFAFLRDSSGSKFKADEGLMKVTLTPVNGNGDTKSFLLVRAEDDVVFSNTEEVDEDTYTVTLQTNTGNIRLNTVYEFLNGGSYVLVMHDDQQTAGQVKSQLVTVTPANNIHILWLLPQYILMAWGEILFIVSGMEFSFTEAPASMKSVLQAIWHLMNACGNVIVIIAALFHGHSSNSQDVEFFVFAALMMADSIIFAFMAYRYKYVSSGETPVIVH